LAAYNFEKKPTLLHLISSVRFHGAERVVSELCRYAKEFKVYVVVMGMDRSLQESFNRAINRRDVSPIFLKTKAQIDINCLKQLITITKKNSIVIIHSHGYKSNFYALLIRCFNPNVKLIATNHNWIGKSKKEKMYQYIDRITLRFFHALVAVSDSVKKDMINRGLNSAKIRTIANGVDVNDPAFSTPSIYIRKKIGLSPDETVIGNIARLSKEKAHIDLLKAFSHISHQNPNLRLVIVGDGPEQSNILRCAVDFEINDRLLMLGHRADARQLYAGFDIFVLSSRIEGMPMVLLEAMAAGVPVIAPKVGGIPAVISHEENGLLFESGDINGLTKQINKLIRHSSLRQSIVERARETVDRQFSSTHMTREYEKLYRQVIRS